MIGKDVCTLLVDGRRRVRDYACKTLTHSLVYSMSADEFTYMLNAAHFKVLRRGVRAFGHWMIMKLNLKQKWRNGTLDEIALLATPRNTSPVVALGDGASSAASSPRVDPALAGAATSAAVAAVASRVETLEASLREVSSKIDMLLTHQIRDTPPRM